MKLALALVSSPSDMWGDLPLTDTVQLEDYLLPFTLLLVIFCCFHLLVFTSINSSVPLFVPIILNYLLELLID